MGEGGAPGLWSQDRALGPLVPGPGPGPCSQAQALSTGPGPLFPRGARSIGPPVGPVHWAPLGLCPLVPPWALSTGPPLGPVHWSPLGLGPLGPGPGPWGSGRPEFRPSAHRLGLTQLSGRHPDVRQAPNVRQCSDMRQCPKYATLPSNMNGDGKWVWNGSLCIENGVGWLSVSTFCSTFFEPRICFRGLTQLFEPAI